MSRNLIVVGWCDCRVSKASKFTELHGQHLPAAWRLRTSITRASCPLAFGRKIDAERALQGLNKAGVFDVEQFNKLTREQLMQIVGESMTW